MAVAGVDAPAEQVLLVEFRVDPEIPPLYFDEVLIERVIYNLLDNAAKYSGQS